MAALPPAAPAPLLSDFRSDTVTRPTPAMRRAMAEAEVGDDVFGDDPTVLRLEAEAARLLGKERALFCPSGTMANLLALLVHCRPGKEALVEARSHTYRYEQGGAARFAGVQLRAAPADDAGRFALDDLLAEVVPGAGAPPGVRLHCAPTALVVVENTHNFAGGRVQPLALVEALGEALRARGVGLHMDGARLLNACAATGVSPAAYAAPCDTVMLGLSKGLGAPVGSLLAGSAEHIDEARRARKALGGGMRQVGVLAAPALLALTAMPARLAEDHARARRLAEGLAGLPGVLLDPARVETNIVILRLAGGADAHARFVRALGERGVGASALGAYGVRFVTHLDVGDADVERALDAARAVLA